MQCNKTPMLYYMRWKKNVSICTPDKKGCKMWVGSPMPNLNESSSTARRQLLMFDDNDPNGEAAHSSLTQQTQVEENEDEGFAFLDNAYFMESEVNIVPAATDNSLEHKEVQSLSVDAENDSLLTGDQRNVSCQVNLREMAVEQKDVECQVEIKAPSKSIACQVILHYELCVQDPAQFRYFTGLTLGEFDVVYELLGGDAVCSKIKYSRDGSTPIKRYHTKLSLKTCLFMTLVRMRRDLSLRDIAYIMKISVTHAGVICYTRIRFLAVTMKDLMLFMAVSSAIQNRNKPLCFVPFKNLRMVIDCAEFPIERSSDLQQQSNTFSDYKHYNTGKVLIGISCDGGVSYVSDVFEGRMTDKEIVQRSDFLTLLNPGDKIMADRGFKIEEELASLNCELLRPPDKPSKGNPFSSREVTRGKTIVSVRIYVEHVIGKMKDWNILANRVELMMLPYLADIVLIAAFLYNFTRIYIGKEPKKPKREKQRPKQP